MEDKFELHVPDDAHKMADAPFVSVDYDEGKPETYRGIVVDWEGKETRINTGSFKRDYDYVCTEYTPFHESSKIHAFMMEVK